MTSGAPVWRPERPTSGGFPLRSHPAGTSPPSEAAGDTQGRSPHKRYRTTLFVLIGLVSISGALMTTAAVGLSERAADEDVRAVTETLLRQRARARIESQLRADRSQYARYRALLAEASGLEAAAGATSNPERARMMHQEAEALRRVAVRLPIAAYVHHDGAGLRFDEAQRRDHVTVDYPETAADRAEEAARSAERLRERSLRLIGFVVALAAVALAMMVAQLAPARRWRPLIGAAATVCWAAVVLAAIVGDRG